MLSPLCGRACEGAERIDELCTHTGPVWYKLLYTERPKNRVSSIERKAETEAAGRVVWWVAESEIESE